MAFVTPEALATSIEQGKAPCILDVRSDAEFDAGHVPGAVHISFGKVRDRTVAVPSPPGDPIVVYCGHGPRAWIAGASLRRRGFTRVTYLRGHWSAWTRAGLPEETPDQIAR